MRRVIAPGALPEMDEEQGEVEEHTIVVLDRTHMRVNTFDYEEPFHYERIA